MYERIQLSTRLNRLQWLAEAEYNLFNLNSCQVMIDLLTDSGSGAMSDRQWASILSGDESYAGSASFLDLKKVVGQIFGIPNCLPVHQGRAAENVLFSALLHKGDLVPGNGHFDTTRGHIEFREAEAMDCGIHCGSNKNTASVFRGDLDVDKLKYLFVNHRDRIPLVLLTITNSVAGGHPVSMRNIRETAEICVKYGCPLFIDAARFAENALFVKQHEPGYTDASIRSIVLEMFSHSSGFLLSAKKDAACNIGGLIAMRDKQLLDSVAEFVIRFEGFLTYGGLAGRDLAAMATGLEEALDCDLLEARAAQITRLGAMLSKDGLPVLEPLGGHAVFIDVAVFFPLLPSNECPAHTLALELYLEGGVRSLGIDGDQHWLRLALPRRTYTDTHLAHVARSLQSVYSRRYEMVNGYNVTFEHVKLKGFTRKYSKI